VETQAQPSEWDPEAVAGALDACVHEGARTDILSGADPNCRAMNAHYQMSYFPSRFRSRPNLYRRVSPRSESLDLPFRAEDYQGVRFPSS
jgi:hypothetical protein